MVLSDKMIQEELGLWLSVARRLKATAREVRGKGNPAVVSISVLIDGDGIPLVWTAPDMTKLEPKSHAANHLLSLLADRL